MIHDDVKHTHNVVPVGIRFALHGLRQAILSVAPRANANLFQTDLCWSR